MNNTPLYFEDVEFGDDIGPIIKEVSDQAVIDFVSIREPESEPSRFTSKEVAQSQGLPEAIVPGAMNIALMSQLLTGWSDNVSLLKLDVVFRKTVPHNTPLKFSGIITDKDESGSNNLECDITMENEEGVKLVIGNALIYLPNRP